MYRDICVCMYVHIVHNNVLSCVPACVYLCDNGK